MTMTTMPRPGTGTGGRPVDGRAAVALPGTRNRRSVPRILAGALAAVLGAVVFGVIGLRTDPAVEVLAVARPVTAGAVIVDADLTVVRIVPDPALPVVPASDRSTVVGQVAAVPLTPGSLLTTAQLGPTADPPPGQSVIAVGVKTGRAPVAALAAGAAVLVLVIPAGADTTTPAVQAAAVVRSVELTDSAGVTVVTLQLASEAAVRIASATGEVALVLQSPGR